MAVIFCQSRSFSFLYPRGKPGRQDIKKTTTSTRRTDHLAELRATREKKKTENAEKVRGVGASAEDLDAVMTRKNSKGDRQSGQGTQGAQDQGDGSSTGQSGTSTPGACPTMDAAQREFFLAMEERLTKNMNTRTDRIDRLLQSNIERIDSNVIAIKDVREKADKLEKKLFEKLQSNEEEIKKRDAVLEEKILDQMNKRDADLNKRVEEAVTAAIGGAGGLIAVSADKGGGADRKRDETSYLIHRRSLRLWPVRGSEPVKELKKFLKEKMKLGELAMSEIGEMSVQVLTGSAEKTRGEVIATFRSAEIRDLVKAAAVNLAGNKEAGTRIQVPGYLMDNFRALEAVGYSMKKAGKDVKRSIKYDDNNRDLIMDIKIGEDWMRITPDEARAVARDNPDIKTGPKKLNRQDISRFLSTGSISKPEEPASPVVVVMDD